MTNTPFLIRLISHYSTVRLGAAILPWTLAELILIGSVEVVPRVFGGMPLLAWALMPGPLLIAIDWFIVVVLNRSAPRKLALIGMVWSALFLLCAAFLMVSLLEYSGTLVRTYGGAGVVLALIALRLGMPFESRFLSRGARECE